MLSFLKINSLPWFFSGEICSIPLFDSIVWEDWHEKVVSKDEIWKQFPKGTMPATQDRKFKTAVNVMVKLLLEEKSYSKYHSLLAFLKEHPKINLILLQFAALGREMKGTFTQKNLGLMTPSRILVSSLEVIREHFFLQK